MFKDVFTPEPLAPVITCPSCGETLMYGDEQCRFCQVTIDYKYARESASTNALVTQAIKSANIIRSLRNLLYFLLAMAVFGALTATPSTVLVTFIVSIVNLCAPIQWYRHFGKLSVDDAELVRAKKNMRVEVYMWCAAIIVFAIAWSVLVFIL